MASVPCRLMEGPSSCEDEDIGFESRSWRFLLHMHGLGVKGASLVYILVVPTVLCPEPRKARGAMTGLLRPDSPRPDRFPCPFWKTIAFLSVSIRRGMELRNLNQVEIQFLLKKAVFVHGHTGIVKFSFTETLEHATVSFSRN